MPRRYKQGDILILENEFVRLAFAVTDDPEKIGKDGWHQRFRVRFITAEQAKDWEIPIREYITVSLLGSGYAAIHMRWYDDMNGYDVQQTGIGRYRTREAATTEAIVWAQSDNIPLRLEQQR